MDGRCRVTLGKSDLPYVVPAGLITTHIYRSSGSKALPLEPTDLQALPAVSPSCPDSLASRSEAEPREQCVPRQSLGTRSQAMFKRTVEQLRTTVQLCYGLTIETTITLTIINTQATKLATPSHNPM